MKYYQVFGLKFASEFKIPAPSSEEKKPDVTIHSGSVPDFLEDATYQGGLYQVSSNRFLLNVERVARFLVQDGNQITIQKNKNVDVRDVLVFLLNSVMAALLHQRKKLVLHGSAVKTSKGAILFIGDSGVGKSSLACAFHEKGYDIISDEICYIDMDPNKNMIVHPGYPRLNIWEDARKQMKIDKNSVKKLRTQLGKYSYDLKNNYYSKALKIHEIYSLSLSNQIENNFHFQELNGMEKIDNLVQNTYRLRYLRGHRDKKFHFDHCVKLAEKVKITEFARNMKCLSIEKTVDALTESVKS